MNFAGRGILLDIEGTSSPLAFVHQTLFPYARAEAGDFLRRRWNEPAVANARSLIARDAGVSLDQWGGSELPEVGVRVWLLAEVQRLMDRDAKATGLKELQGLIWQEGYAAGRLVSEVFPDVLPALRAWTEHGLDVRIYSSGSVAAQKVFFAHTAVGSLSSYLRGHYDTTSGPKREPASYTRIAADMDLPPGAILFLSDVVAELDAATAAGLQTGLVVRPGNPAAPPGHGHPVLTEFGQIKVTSDAS